VRLVNTAENRNKDSVGIVRSTAPRAPPPIII